ncbi:MAG: RIP metalloprotease RseP [Candidatus Omnitrophica bacterium]|nr:RIP metalloprotease RseP [Candidatus Omnitrophota bacterium]
MSFFYSIFPTMIVLGVLIVIHEFGHFLACRLFKVRVEKFSIGFGPEILHWQGKETRYTISLFPLGGFVKPAGESISEVDSKEGLKPGDYLAASLGARIFIVSAGVIMNYILAFFLFSFLFMMGRPVPGTVIGGFVKGYPAETSGLMKKDKIVEVNGKKVQTFFDLTRALDASPQDAAKLTIERSGELLPIEINLKSEEVKDPFGTSIRVKRLGISPYPASAIFERYSLQVSLKHAAQTVIQLAVNTYRALFLVATGKMSFKSMSGPIGIISMTGDAARMGLPYVLQLMATLSVSLAVINLLPIPALDGGHLMFLLVEAFRRKTVSLEVQDKATQVGFALLLALMVFIIYNDVVNLDVIARIKHLF